MWATSFIKLNQLKGIWTTALAFSFSIILIHCGTYGPQYQNTYSSIIIDNTHYDIIDSIPIRNGSFEKIKPGFLDTWLKNRYTELPVLPIQDWVDCGSLLFPGETPVTIYSGTDPKPFQVTQNARYGFNYLGMVTRETNTWESVSQFLDRPLEAGRLYAVRFLVSHSSTLRSPIINLDENLRTFDAPARLRILVGNAECAGDFIVASTKPITSKTWEEVEVIFSVESQSHYFIIEVFYPEDNTTPANGNVLLDHVSPIYEIQRL